LRWTSLVLLGVFLQLGHARLYTQEQGNLGGRLDTLRRLGGVPRTGERAPVGGRRISGERRGAAALSQLRDPRVEDEEATGARTGEAAPQSGEAPAVGGEEARVEPPAGAAARAPALGLSAFEKQLSGYRDDLVDAPVLQFGYEVLARPRDGFADIPVGGQYVLGPGDRLVVSVWGGTVDADYVETIDRQGQLRLPEVGLVTLLGLTLDAAEGSLRREFDRFYKNYQLRVRLERVREVPVHVVGRVASPGRVRVSAVGTVLDALAAAGGVTKDGSLRKLVLRRQGEADRSLDLYRYLVDGDLSVDAAVAANDVILVPPVGPRVAVVGRVERPAIYEVERAATTFAALLALSGGYARLADPTRLQVESVSTAGLVARSVDLAATRPDAVELADGDVVLVATASPKIESVVYLVGNVARPGRYPHREGMRVSDLVTAEALIEAGFWLDRVPPRAAAAEGERLSRELVQRARGGAVVDGELGERVDLSVRETRRPEAFAEYPEPYLDYALVRRIDPATKQERRLAFDLGKAIFSPKSDGDPVLQSQDTVHVFPRSAFEAERTVYVSGAVHKPGEYRFFDGMRVRDLVRMAGGLLPEAYLARADLTRIHPEQSGVRFEHLKVDLAAVLAGTEGADLALSADDALAVKVVPEYRKTLRVTLEGEVRQPGIYTVIPGERLSALLDRAGGFSQHAYLPASQFYRASVRRLQEQRIEESLRRLELETKLAVQRYTSEAAATGEQVDVLEEQARIDRLIASIRRTPAVGRMVLRLSPLDKLRGAPDDVELEDGDRLVVVRQPQEVHVVGAVFNQTALLYQRDLKTRDYLERCGGPAETAEVSLAYVIRSDGSAESAQSAGRGYSWDPERGRFVRAELLDTRLFPGDTLVVPYDVKPQLSRLGLTSTVAQILFQSALATGVIVALL
jgi:protein involved in polysaccharide export with SLBB domain